MAKLVFTDGEVTVNSVDLSDHIASVTVTTTYDEIDTSSITDGFRTRVAGMGDASVSIEFHQDFAASSVNATIQPLLGTTTSVVVKPTSAAVSATNPSYTGTALVTEWSTLDANAGELVTASVTWPVSGGWTEATA